MADRLLSADALSHPVALDALPPDEVLAGAPRAGAVSLGEVGGAEVGLWEMTTGVARDTEVDEVFVVLAGRGHVEFEDGTRLTLRPGVVVRLHAGDHTTWSIEEALRKVWVA